MNNSFAHFNRIERIADALLDGQQNVTSALVQSIIDVGVNQVEAWHGVEIPLDHPELKAILTKLVRRYATHSQQFKLAGISKNTNAFGLNQYVFVAEDGTAYKACAAKAYKSYVTGDILNVRLQRGVPDFTALGFEIPELTEPVPQVIVNKIWKGGAVS